MHVAKLLASRQPPQQEVHYTAHSKLAHTPGHPRRDGDVLYSNKTTYQHLKIQTLATMTQSIHHHSFASPPASVSHALLHNGCCSQVNDI
jgi:hypothetical protein